VGEISDVDPQVREYYSRNWTKIVQCYDLDEHGLPTDSAWYRRQIYIKYLENFKPRDSLDVGCGGGQTVIDALERGILARGVEPIKEMVHHGRQLLARNGFEGDAIQEGDASVLHDWPDSSVDSIAFLSVLPHIPRSEWDDIHREIHRVLRPSGTAIIAYRNQLFDLYTINRYTFEFFMEEFFSSGEFDEPTRQDIEPRLRSLIPNYHLPQLEHTNSEDKSFGKLQRARMNPFDVRDYVRSFGFKIEEISVCNFHPQPPLLGPDSLKLRKIKHRLEESWSTNWRGYFMSSMFVASYTKE
jgi:SAM-dependent methyltransferase